MVHLFTGNWFNLLIGTRLVQNGMEGYLANIVGKWFNLLIGAIFAGQNCRTSIKRIGLYFKSLTKQNNYI